MWPESETYTVDEEKDSSPSSELLTGTILFPALLTRILPAIIYVNTVHKKTHINTIDWKYKSIEENEIRWFHVQDLHAILHIIGLLLLIQRIMLLFISNAQWVHAATRVENKYFFYDVRLPEILTTLQTK